MSNAKLTWKKCVDKQKISDGAVKMLIIFNESLYTAGFIRNYL